MKQIRRSSKLVVSRETIKALSTTQLEHVVGGYDSAPGDTCPTQKHLVVPVTGGATH
jgi:hypothetical protein